MNLLHILAKIAVFNFGSGDVYQPESLEDVYRPVDVAVAPENAFKGLVRLPDGEIRHYGYERVLPDEGSGKSEHQIYYTAEKRFYYLSSRDNGLTWKRVDPAGGGIADPPRIGGETPNGLGGSVARSPKTGWYFKLVSTKENGAFVQRARNLEDEPEAMRVSGDGFGMIRAPFFLRGSNRVLFSAQTKKEHPLARNRVVVFRSDDDGGSWQGSEVPGGPEFQPVWPHEGIRWQNHLAEPTLTELSDGRLWMLFRTSLDHHYESFSDDRGMTWTPPRPSRFYGTLTMPTFLRLKDGRLLLFWCNTTPLPEVDRSSHPTMIERKKNGGGEDVFTNRDANHVAISEDDGRTWTGFRELRLNPIRNEADYATRGRVAISIDRSVHQFQALELPGNKVLVSYGQHPECRRIALFDVGWIYETSRSSAFEDGKASWSTFKFRKGIVGHCAYNRDPGAPLINHPDRPGRQVLHLRRTDEPDHIFQRDGAVWNFPAATKGDLRLRLQPREGGQGIQICLVDRWFNPTDPVVHRYAQYVLNVAGDGGTGIAEPLQPGQWNEILFRWSNPGSDRCSVTVNGGKPTALRLRYPSQNGVSYLHLQSLATDEDERGTLIESVAARCL